MRTAMTDNAAWKLSKCVGGLMGWTFSPLGPGGKWWQKPGISGYSYLPDFVNSPSGLAEMIAWLDGHGTEDRGSPTGDRRVQWLVGNLHNAGAWYDAYVVTEDADYRATGATAGEALCRAICAFGEARADGDGDH